MDTARFVAALLCVLAACQPDVQRRGPVVPDPSSRAPMRTAPDSTPLCVLVGPTAEMQGVYGTDLGFSVPRGSDTAPGQVILFGDTWGEAGDACRYAPDDDDDLIATIPMSLPDRLPRSPSRQVACGLVEYDLNDAGDVRSWTRARLYEASGPGAPATRPLSLGFLRTPLAAFGARDQVYGLFHRNDPVACQGASDCPGSMACTTEQSEFTMGQCGKPPGAPDGGARTFCLTDEDCAFSSCEYPQTGGYCYSQAPFALASRDGQSPDWYRADPRRGAAHVVYVARMEDGPRLGDFDVVARFATNRFVNLAVSAIAHFDPEHPERNDYRPGDHTLLIWGRSTFVGDDGFQALPFLLYQPLNFSDGGGLAWDPHFFAGLDASGHPTWTTDEERAQPLYGTDTRIGGNGELVWTDPEFDIVNQMSLTWLPGRDRWLMLYGGDAPDFFLGESAGQAPRVQYGQPVEGAIHMRHAPHPWGADPSDAADGWSQPEPVLTPRQAAAYMACPESDPQAMPGCLAQGDPHGPFDLFETLVGHATELTPEAFAEVTAQCFAGSFAGDVQENLNGGTVGRLYAPNVITPWTRVDADGRETRLLWNVSTWNPYQVILVETPLNDAMFADRVR